MIENDMKRFIIIHISIHAIKSMVENKIEQKKFFIKLHFYRISHQPHSDWDLINLAEIKVRRPTSDWCQWIFCIGIRSEYCGSDI